MEGWKRDPKKPGMISTDPQEPAAALGAEKPLEHLHWERIQKMGTIPAPERGILQLLGLGLGGTQSTPHEGILGHGIPEWFGLKGP